MVKKSNKRTISIDDDLFSISVLSPEKGKNDIICLSLKTWVILDDNVPSSVLAEELKKKIRFSSRKFVDFSEYFSGKMISDFYMPSDGFKKYPFKFLNVSILTKQKGNGNVEEAAKAMNPLILELKEIIKDTSAHFSSRVSKKKPLF